MDLDMQRAASASPPAKSAGKKAGRWLPLAAAPAFLVMAVASAFAPPTMTCSTDGFSLSGMATMYLLMGLFHLPPWLSRMGRA